MTTFAKTFSSFLSLTSLGYTFRSPSDAKEFAECVGGYVKFYFFGGVYGVHLK